VSFVFSLLIFTPPFFALISIYVTGYNKQNDSANFGIFKQNWGILRVCAARAGFVGQSTANWNNGAKLKYEFSLLTLSLISSILL
jgi:hypothetical protein